MPNFCSAFGCANKSCHLKCIEQRITFHKFPLKKPELLKEWLRKIKRYDFHPNVYSRICSVHFKEDDFEYYGTRNRRQLKPGSVPSIFNFQKNGKKRKGVAYLDRVSSEKEITKIIASQPVAAVPPSAVRTQVVNDSLAKKPKIYVIRCNPQNGGVVKRQEENAAEPLLAPLHENTPSEHYVSSENTLCANGKTRENCYAATERRHKEKMQKWDILKFNGRTS